MYVIEAHILTDPIFERIYGPFRDIVIFDFSIIIIFIGHSSLCTILAAMTATRRTVQGFREKYRKPHGARKIFPRNPQGLALYLSERRVATFAERIDTSFISPRLLRYPPVEADAAIRGRS